MAITMSYTMKLVYVCERMAREYGFRENFPEVENNISVDVTLNSPYMQVKNIDANKDVLNFELIIFKDSTKKFEVERRSYSCAHKIDDGASNSLKQGYEYLKTLPEFSSAVDILEEGQTA